MIKQEKKISIGIVDDHKIVRDGIRAMLLAYPQFEIILESSDGEHMLTSLSAGAPDILIADINLPGMDGLSLCRQCMQRYPDMKIMVLSASADESVILEAIGAGVHAYLHKESDAAEFIRALSCITDGEPFYGEKVSRILASTYMNHLQRQVPGDAALSARETEVLKGFAEGLSYKEIAARLCISPRTIETHRNRIMEKLGLSSLADLIKYALRQGIIKL
jgi:DNA-binding NarL/FixJ family response regulator